MSSSQTFIAGSGVNNNSGGVVAWSGPSNITASNNTYATAALTSSSTTSQYLYAQDFGFEINGMAIIEGIIVSIERKASLASAIKDSQIYLLKAGTYHGNNKSVGAYWSTTEGSDTFGSPTDLWGSSLLPEDVRSSSFGVMIQAQYENAYLTPATAYVDSVEMTIYYTEPTVYYGTTEVKRIFRGTAEIRNLAKGSTELPRQ